MEKIIFFGLVIPIMLFVLYLGVTAIMKGFTAKEANKAPEVENDQELFPEKSNLSDELIKLNKLRESGVITKEDFEKAKNKLLND